MKKQLILWLAAIALIATSCVEDDYAEDSRTPIQFTVSMTGNKATTRSAVDDIWNGGEAVAVQMTSGGSSIVKKYKIDNSESPVKLVPYDSSVQPFYWPHSGSTEVTVSAWYPYAETKQTVATTNTDIKDQSTEENYEAANLMEAADVTRAYNATLPTTPETPLELTFSIKIQKGTTLPNSLQPKWRKQLQRPLISVLMKSLSTEKIASLKCSWPLRPSLLQPNLSS